MGLSCTKWYMVWVGLVILQPVSGKAQPQVPCYFIFGDSIVDNGNNNNLNTLAKANYLPYGVDFPAGPTGRFTNGKTIADIIGEHIGFDDYIPPFSLANGPNIIKGVNYASGSAGIRDQTGLELGDNINFRKQLLNHQTIVSKIASLLGSQTAAKQHMGKCLYNVVIGSNDYINNYFRPSFYNSSALYTPDQYAAVLIEQYYQQLKTLFRSGARKIAVFGLGIAGCTPLEVSSHNGTCESSMNDAIQLFNYRLQLLADELNQELTSAKFIYVDNYSTLQDELTGEKIFNQPCCENTSEIGLCIPGSPLCDSRSSFMFWDAVHPSQSLYTTIGSQSYNAIVKSGVLSNSLNYSSSR